MKTFWLSYEYFQWPIYSDGGHSQDPELRRRPYDFLEHSYSILKSDPSALARADVIANLKKALRNRVETLEKLYAFKKIPIAHLPDGQLERLVFLEIVKPNMYKELIELRNQIEHRDSAPPEVRKCEELAEFTWYFLRSTDRLVLQVNSGFNIMNPGFYGENGWLRVGPEKSNIQEPWEIHLDGVVPQEFVSPEPKQRWISIHAKEFESVGDYKTRMNGIPPKSLLEGYQSTPLWEEYPLTHIDFSGTVEEDASKQFIYSLFFANA